MTGSISDSPHQAKIDQTYLGPELRPELFWHSPGLLLAISVVVHDPLQHIDIVLGLDGTTAFVGLVQL
jgi:hypothetical protein